MMFRNKTFLLAFVLFLVAKTANAEYMGSVEVRASFVGAYQLGESAQYAYFGAPSQPGDTCDFWGRHWRFDATTKQGQAMHRVLLVAVSANKKVDVWYVSSPKQGTNHTNGCSPEFMAEVTALGLSD